MKKFFATALFSCALAACSFIPGSASAAGLTMEDYANLRGAAVTSKLDIIDLAEARRTAPQLKEVGDWYRRVAYYLGNKDYAITTGWAPQQIQLVTPYSLVKYLNFEASEKLMPADQKLIDEVAQYKDIVWVWVWSNGSYGVLNTDSPAPVVENVVIRTPDNTFNYYLDKDQYIPVNAMAKARLPQAQLWPFPAKLFSQRNVPFEVIVVDDKGNKKPLSIGPENLGKCK